MDSGTCGAPTSPTETAPFKAKYPTFGATISPQFEEAQEAVAGVAYNECGGWGTPWTNAKLP